MCDLGSANTDIIVNSLWNIASALHGTGDILDKTDGEIYTAGCIFLKPDESGKNYTLYAPHFMLKGRFVYVLEAYDENGKEDPDTPYLIPIDNIDSITHVEYE